MTHGAWKGPSNTANTQVSLVTTEGDSESVVKSVVKLPPVMAGMDRAEALAFVSRLYDSAQAGAHVWGDALLVKRFLTQCSRTGSQETRDGCRREVPSCGGATGTTLTFTSGRSIHRWPRTGCPSCGKKSTPDS